MKDYYKVLGVKPSASSDEIKRAFKKLAKQYHPDANKGDKSSEERFKKVSEAYEVLINDESRKKYDEEFRYTSGSDFHRGYKRQPFHSSRTPEQPDFVRDFFERVTKSKGDDFSFFDSFANGGADFFGNFSGAAGRHNADLKIPLSTAYGGGEVQVSGLPGGVQNIKVPAGISNGSIMKISTSNGPFELKINVENAPPFVLKGNSIETAISLNLAQAVLGSKVKLRDPKGADLIITIPEGTQPGAVLRLRGLGLSGADLFVKLEIKVPNRLSEEEAMLFKKFAEKSGMKY